MSKVKGIIAATEAKLDPAKTPGLNGVYQFMLIGDEPGEFYMTFVDGNGSISEGVTEDANITLTMSTENSEKIITGKLNPNMAFMTGKLKVKGDMQLALKLQAILG